MRQALVLLIAIFTTATVFGQDDGRVFKKFKVDLSFGYAMPQESGDVAGGTKAGALFAIEPKYAVMDQLSIGLRMEAAVMANVDINGETGEAKANASYVLTGDYYFSNNKFRPFAGAGGGMYTSAKVTDDMINNDDEIPTKTNFGFMARAGFELGHLRVGAEYNFVPDKAGYFGIKLGVCIGGGRL